MKTDKDLYRTLKVRRDATPEEITKAYRRLALKYHPDRCGGDDTIFKKIQDAYDVLGDADLRRQYDATGEIGRKSTFDSKYAGVIEVIGQVFTLVIKAKAGNSQAPVPSAGLGGWTFLNVYESILEHLKQSKDGLKRGIQENESCASLLRQERDKFTVEDGEENLMRSICDANLAEIERANEMMKKHLDMHDAAVEYLKRVKYGGSKSKPLLPGTMPISFFKGI